MGKASRSNTDVLVVGAGPVGLTVACELLRRGIRCRVIDKAGGPSETSKALGIQSRTLEVFQGMGIIEEFLARGLKITGANVYEGEELLFQPETRHLRAPYPYILSLPQGDTERLLLGLLRELGGEVEWSKELVGFGQDRDRVVAFAGEDLEEIQAGWVIGGDGAHSRVRHTLGVPFEGSAYEEEFLLADVELDWEKNRDRAHAWLHEDGIFLSIPLPGDNQWRLIADLNPPEGEEAPRASVELFQELMEERARDTRTTISNPAWMSNFRISRRMVSEYRRGRVFLMGDAAHIHSPVGGQGMNTGIQDAYNLGWKLALVVKGKAPDGVLNTYQEERLPVAKGVLRATNLSTNLLVSRNPALRFVRDQALTRLMGSGFLQETLLKKVSQLDVNYRASPLSESHESLRTLLPNGSQEKPGLKDWLDFRTAPKAGDRAPQGRCKLYPSRKATSLFEEMRGTGFTLLLFNGPASTGYKRLARLSHRTETLLGEDIKTYIVARDEPDGLDWDGSILLDTGRELRESYGAGAECLYLIRPDGYIGFRSQPAYEDRLLDYLRELLMIDDATHHTSERSTVLDNS